MLTLKDIFLKKKQPTTRMVVYREGRWSFANPLAFGRLVRQTQSQRYYQMDVKFGTKKSRASNPAQPHKRGMPGDYLAQDGHGVYSVLTEWDFIRLFPIPNQNPPHNPCTNKELSDPKFLTDVIQKQTAATSNTQYGTSYKQNFKKTLKKQHGLTSSKSKLSGITGMGKPKGQY